MKNRLGLSAASKQASKQTALDGMIFRGMQDKKEVAEWPKVDGLE